MIHSHRDIKTHPLRSLKQAPTSLTTIAQACLRLLQLHPREFLDLWDWSPFLALLLYKSQHPQPLSHPAASHLLQQEQLVEEHAGSKEMQVDTADTEAGDGPLARGKVAMEVMEEKDIKWTAAQIVAMVYSMGDAATVAMSSQLADLTEEDSLRCQIR